MRSCRQQGGVEIGYTLRIDRNCSDGVPSIQKRHDSSRGGRRGGDGRGHGLVTSATADQGCCYGTYDLALSANQIQFSASDYIYDTNLNTQSALTLNDREAQSISYVYGSKLSPDGSLLFLPSTSGMDIFDGRLGILRDRIALPMSLSLNYDALVEDGEDNILVAITGQTGGGIAVLDFSSIAEPSPLSYPGADFSKVRLREGTPSSSAETSPSSREGHPAAGRPLH